MTEENRTITVPRIGSVRQIAATGVLPEHALRMLIKQGVIKPIMVGNRQMVNLDTLIAWLNEH